jgi:manganese oxidase
MANPLNRRDFLKLAGITLGGAGVAAAAGAGVVSLGGVRRAGAADGGHGGNGILRQGNGGEDWREMDEHHKEGVDIFLGNIGKDPNFWLPDLEYTMDGDVKVFTLTTSEVDWDTGGGMTFPAMAYNGQVPGPTIRVTEGDKVRVNITNNMTQSTAIHFHGVRVPNSQDGVPLVTQPVIEPGTTYTYEFPIREGNSGTHMYHSHHNSAEQNTRGLLGGFIIEPKDKTNEPVVDAEYIFVLNDSALGFTFNGRGFPYTQPIIGKLGQTIRIRYMNEGLMIHPMHLHGIPQKLVAKDGYSVPMPQMLDTLNIAPGERYDVLVLLDDPGVWAFHCHILNHAEARDGMFGMVTVLIVQDE